MQIPIFAAQFPKIAPKIMAVTRLKRKGLRNKARAKQRKQRIKELTRMPPIVNVDVEAIKAEFAQKSGKPVSQPKAEKASTTDETTAEIREPAKGSVEDAEIVAAEDDKKGDTLEVAPEVITPEAGAPEEAASSSNDEAKAE